MPPMHTTPPKVRRACSPTDNATLTYRFVGSVPGWLQTAFNSAVQEEWLANNNSRAPRFVLSSSGAGSVMYASASPCAPAVPDWIGCTRDWGKPNWRIWIRSGIIGGHCENNNNASGCYRAGRIALHEAEHATLTTSESPQSALDTNMGGCGGYCHKPNSGWDSNSWKECDQAAFQLKYGLQSLSGQYSSCLDHVAGAGSGGLAVVQTVNSSTGTTCTGVPISRSGRIATKTLSGYGLLSNLGIAGRLIRIDRKLSSSSTWTLNWASFTTSTNQTGYNWSRSFSESVAGTYNYRVRFAGEAGLAYSDMILTITYINSPCPNLVAVN